MWISKIEPNNIEGLILCQLLDVSIQEYKVKMYLRMRWHDPRLAFGETLQRDVVNVDSILYNQVSGISIIKFMSRLTVANCFAPHYSHSGDRMSAYLVTTH